MNKKTKGIAISAIAAGAAGFVAGILTAPKSGKETRKDIKDTAVKVKTETEKDFKKIHQELTKYLAQATSKLKSAKSGSKQDLTEAVLKATVAKDKVRTILSAFHEGDAQDGDLKKAVAESTKALEHLKTYIAKDGK